MIITALLASTAGLSQQWFVYEIKFGSPPAANVILLTTCKVGLLSVPIPEFAVYDVYHDLFFDPLPNPFCVLVRFGSGRDLFP